MRRFLAALVVGGSMLALTQPAAAAPRQAAQSQDQLGMPVFIGADPVPDEPVRYRPRGMMRAIYQKDKGGDSFWIDRMLTREGDDPAGTWLMTRGRAAFMKEHDPSVLGFGGRLAYWESIDDRDGYVIDLGADLREDVAERRQMPSHWEGRYTGDGLSVTVDKFITRQNVLVTTLAITNTGTAKREVPVTVTSPYAKTPDGDRELTGVVTARNRLTTIFPRLSGDGLKADGTALKGTLTIGPGKTVRTKVQLGLVTEELPQSREEYDAYRGRSPEQALARHVRDYNAWWADNLPYIDVPDENIKKYIYYRWWLMRFNYLDADIPGNDFQFPTSVEGALGYNNAIVLTVPMFLQDLKYLRDPIYSYGPWVSVGEVSRNSKYTDNPGDPENWSNSYTQYISASALEAYQLHGGQPAILRNLAHYAEKDVYGQLSAYDSNGNGVIEYDWEAMTGNDADAVSFHYYGGANERAEGAYVYANAMAAAQAYELIGDTAKAAEMRGVAEKVKNGILTVLWDDQDKVFKHRDLRTGHLIPWKEANNYIPFAVGLVPADEPKYREALRLWADPAEYPIFPFYTANQKDKAEAAAQGKPGTNNFSQINSTRNFSLFSKALHQYRSPYITPEMYKQLLYWNAWAQFIGGDTRYPDANEYWADWNPATKTIGYRSWIHHTILGSGIWTVIEDVMGLRPRGDAKVELWPVDIGWDHFAVSDIDYRGRDLAIVWDRPDGKAAYPGVPEGYSIFIDGKRTVTLAKLTHAVWDPATGRVEAEAGAVRHSEAAHGMKAPVEVALKGDRIEDMFAKAGVSLTGDAPNLVASARASHGDPAGAVDGFTINEPFWGSKGSGNATDWLEADLGSARKVDDVRLYFYNDRKPNGYSEPALYTIQYLDGGEWKDVPRQVKSPAYPRANLNEVRFPPVTTSKLRVVVAHRPGYATGLKEVQVFATGAKVPGAKNRAPYVLVVPDETVNRPGQARLNAVVKDDGLPSGRLTAEWSLVDGPGEAFFSDPAGAAGTTVSFTKAGTYRVRLTAADGELSTSATVAVTVSDPGQQANIAPYATPTASYTSPWETVKAINDGIEPPKSNDGANPRWGTWPQRGTQWAQLEWPAPVRVNKSDVYFFDDGGGVRLPASWKLQYWDGAAFQDIPAEYPIAADAYNTVVFDPVTTTRLRVVLQSGQGSVGLLEWKAYAVPPDGVRPVHIPTLVNTLPELPGTVETTYADGGRGTAKVIWQAVRPDQVATGGSRFTVAGLAEGVRDPVHATVYVRATDAVTITSIAEEQVTTRAGIAPSLPGTVVATYNDGSRDSRVKVTWDDVDPAQYAGPGTFTVTGHVAGTTVEAKAVVTVI